MNQLSGSECKAESKILHLLQFKPIPTKHLLQWYIIKCGFRCLGVTCTLDAFSCGYLNHLRNLSATQKLKLSSARAALNSQLYRESWMGDNNLDRIVADSAAVAILLFQQLCKSKLGNTNDSLETAGYPS